MGKKRIGIHIRLESLTAMVEKAHRLSLPFFQCLLVHQITRRLIEPGSSEIKAFKAACKRYRISVFQHASYYFNLCNPGSYKIPPILVHELHVGQKLGLTRMVLHPGTIVAASTKEESIAVLAKALDALIEQFPKTTFYLENTANSTPIAVGSDFNDFAQLLTVMKHSAKLSFCIDTAHAYAFGYDIATLKGQNAFIKLVDQTIGLDRVALLHLNNTDKNCGSGIDRHTAWKTGLIPPKLLLRFMNLAPFKKLPIILELPVRMSEEHEQQMVQEMYDDEKGELHG